MWLKIAHRGEGEDDHDCGRSAENPIRSRVTLNGRDQLSGVGEPITQFLVDLKLSKLEFFFALFVLYTVLGCLVEGLGMIVVTVPLLYAVLLQYGIDPTFGAVTASKDTRCTRDSDATESLTIRVYCRLHPCDHRFPRRAPPTLVGGTILLEETMKTAHKPALSSVIALTAFVLISLSGSDVYAGPVVPPGHYCLTYSTGGSDCSFTSYNQCLTTVSGIDAECYGKPHTTTPMNAINGCAVTLQRCAVD